MSLLMLSFVLALAAAAPAPTQAAATRCVLLATDGGREVLVNRCGACREVKVERRRPGEGFPTRRAFIVQQGTEMPLPFRGGGQTRVLSEGVCEGGTTDRPGADERNCVSIVPNTKAGTVLMNQCDECRSALIETRERDGRRLSQTYAVAALSAIPFNKVNALDARILSQSACKR